MKYNYNMATILRSSSNNKQNSSSNALGLDMVYTDNSQNKTANRRSAVERLEETKANYVKTERVLDCKQNFEHSSNLRVSSTRPDVLLKGRIKNCQNIIRYVNTISVTDNVSSFTSELVPRSSTNLESRFSLEKRLTTALQVDEQPVKHERPESSIVFRHDSHQKQYKLTSRDRQTRSQTFSCGATCFNVNDNTSVQDAYTSHYSVEDERNFRYSQRTEERTEHSDVEQYSLEPSDDSVTADEDLVDLEEKKQSSRTSDYVSRSSSFKCSISSDRVKNLVKSFESKISHVVPSPINLTTVQEKIKPVIRSKSDVGCRLSRNFSVAPEVSDSDEELNRFFNTMGLDSAVFHNLTAPPKSPVLFFDSVSSVNSDDHLSSAESEDSALEVQREGLTNSDLRKHGPTETSIVEKNARVVKWLYNCNNAFKKSANYDG